MLVQRAYRKGAAVLNSEKATTMGVLIGKVGIVLGKTCHRREINDHTSLLYI